MAITALSRCRRAGFSWLLGLLTAGALAAEPPAAELFARSPRIVEMLPSPSGDRVAVILTNDDGRRQLGVLDLPPREPMKVVAAYSDGNVEKVHWVNNDRLVYEVYQPGPVVMENGAGVMAVDRDGRNQRALIAWRHSNWTTGTNIVSRVLTYGWFFHSTIDDGSADILVYHRQAQGAADYTYSLSRLNTQTGDRRPLSFGVPPGTDRWLLDDAFEPRVVTSSKDGRTAIHWRAPASADWKQLESFDSYAGDDGFAPLRVEKGDRLLAVSRVKSDSVALFAYDLSTGKLNPEPLVAVQGFDLAPTLEVDSKTRTVVGVHFEADRPYSYWFDDKLDAAQKMVDAALPNRTNKLRCGRCESARYLVVHSSSDRSPGEYFILDREEKRLLSLGKERPWIDESGQARRSFHRFTARDGLSIPVYVTHPVGAAPSDRLPAVVLVHGGPWVKGANLLWHDDAQFLASRGYRVIEPEFRGSAGYGWKLFRASWKEWGRSMQDDLLDAVQWAGKQGLVDTARVCIMGASYGGYAALMSPIKHPGAYRCAVSFAGVTDIELKYSVHWSDVPEDYKRYGMPRLVGDPEKDRDLLREASPLHRVRELKVPVLLAHGTDDRRVPLEHASKFVSAARDAGVAVDYVPYTDEGHGWYHPKNHADFYRRVETFLAASLRAPTAAAAK
jgi:dipeptidyl aminopeptidase/acylaminoacyl peptidase